MRRSKMPKTTKDIEKKLEYIGLDIKNIPECLAKKETIKFRADRLYDDTSYKIYKYIDIKDIEIFITPSDRLEELNQKFKKADYLIDYINLSNEKKGKKTKNIQDVEEIEKYTTFLEMLKKLDLEKLKELEKVQKKRDKEIPYEIKYKENFIWQIFYSEESNKYFMLFPSREDSVESLFYIIKKKIQTQKSRKKELIYVPISHASYSNNLLKKSEIEDLENYLWLFTKSWPSIYEVHDIEGKESLQIIGQTEVYEKIKSNYKIKLDNKKEAVETYKLIKALFILQSEMSHEYNFKTAINEQGGLEFFYGFRKINYESLSELIKQEFLKNKNEFEKLETETLFEIEKLELLNRSIKKQNEEYMLKEKQIVMFLECKKSFFGKVKYFFQGKKANKKVAKKNTEEKVKEFVENNQEEIKIEEEVIETKELYTIEDLLKIGNKLEQKRIKYKNIQMDIKAAENKKDNLERKIKNATLYINEIESHKKSIFDFWKYANKDEVALLNESEQEQKDRTQEKLKKVFNYEEDIEDFGEKIDDKQRDRFSKNECDAIFAIREDLQAFKILDREKILKKDMTLLEKNLKMLKKEYEEDIENIEAKDFDIFGNVIEDKTKIKILKNKKHREIQKEKYKILNVDLNTDIKEYEDTIKRYLLLLKEAYGKIVSPYDMAVYINEPKEIQEEGFIICNINPKEAIKEVKEKETILYRFNIKEQMPIIYYSNIMFFDNNNNTLPLGMDLSDEVLLNLTNFDTKLISRRDFKVNKIISEFENEVQTVHLYEYSLEGFLGRVPKSGF